MPLVTEEIPGLGGHLRVTVKGVLVSGTDVVPPELAADGSKGHWLGHPNDGEYGISWYTPADLVERTYGLLIGFGNFTFNSATRTTFGADGCAVPVVQVPAADAWNRSATEPAVRLSYVNDAGETISTTMRISDLMKVSDVHIPGAQRSRFVDDDDAGEQPTWHQKLVGRLGDLWSPPEPEPPRNGPSNSRRGHMGGASGPRGRMGASGLPPRGRRGRG